MGYTKKKHETLNKCQLVHRLRRCPNIKPTYWYLLGSAEY